VPSSELDELAAEAQQALLSIIEVPVHERPVRVVAVPVVVAVVGLGQLISCTTDCKTEGKVVRN
jgi:hypothetical protein